MAFDGAYFELDGNSSKNTFNQWRYKTTDTAATVDTANYFLNAYAMGLRAGDVILRLTVDSLSAPTTWLHGFHTCNSASATAVDVTDALSIGSTDTD